MSLYQRFSAWECKPEAGTFANFLGLVTDCNLFGDAHRLSGVFVAADPIPDDGVYGSATEYLAVLEAIDAAKLTGQNSFSMIELGSGWGPWISAAGLICKRENFEQINLAGIEADPDRFQSMKHHFARNGLINESINTKFLNGAVWDESTTLFFPKTGLGDHGGAASSNGVDYRGNASEMQEVKTWTLPSIAEDMGIIDLIHWDIQGAEARVAESSADLLENKVRSVQIGTHSREQEGRLLQLFHEMKWDLLRESPCAFLYNKDVPTIEGMTTTDGELYFRNPRLWTQ